MMTAAEALQEALPDAIDEIVEEGTHPFVRVKAESIVEAARVLRDKCGCDMLHQVSGVDHADKMEVVYHFTRVRNGTESGGSGFECLKVNCSREDPVVPTLAHEWRTANWGERETYDLFGIRFEGHPHLYRILLPEDWAGYPLRKDYEMPTEYHGIDCTE
ncbi:MAG: NADH-quinone oxidoreductase subunit C [Planctomycetota bacterium]|jgi:NADH-quinone oxidoreductase subunit C